MPASRLKYSHQQTPALRVGKNHQGKNRSGKLFGDIANHTSHAAGRPITFILAALTILMWALTGPVFDYSDTGNS